MASVAQEESRKISERVKWGQQRSMERGVVFGCDNIYGFSLQGGELTVKPEQAAVVREVYRRFLMDGKGTYIIARELTAEGIPPPSGKGKSWSSTMVLRLLRGEKYCGDLLQCKSCTPDFLDHRKVKNEGQSPQVYLRTVRQSVCAAQGRTGGRRSTMGVRETGAARRGSVCGSGSWESDFAGLHEANCTGFTNQHRGGIAADLARYTRSHTYRKAAILYNFTKKAVQ